jgi:translation initiation factor eIF-2B subunit gamma
VSLELSSFPPYAHTPISAPIRSLTTKLLDAHVYVFRRPVLDLMTSKDPRDLESIKENFVPWLVKGGWQDSVRAKWNQSKHRRSRERSSRLIARLALAVLNHTSDPLAVALHKSTVASLSLTNDPPADRLDYFESTNATSPSSPAKTPGETLLDFKDSLSGKVAGGKRKSYQGPAPGDELRCAMVIYERPVPEVTPVAPPQNQKGRGQQVVEKEKDVEPPLMRGNTVAVYWELD